MARYLFKCDCGRSEEIIAPMKESPGLEISCPCGSMMSRVLNSVRAQVFKPYTEDRINGQDIRIETPEQRDKLLKEHHLTYDSVKYVQLKKTSAASTLTEEEIINEAQRNASSLRQPEVAEGIEGRIGEVTTSEFNPETVR